MKTVKLVLFVSLILLFSMGCLTLGNADGLKVTFRDVYEDDYFYHEQLMGNFPLGNPTPTQPIPNNTVSYETFTPSDGMKFVVLALTLENTGPKDCTFDFSEVFISTPKDSLYPMTWLRGRYSVETKIKSKKKIKRTVYFEFPKHYEPNELFIEDKRFKIVKKG